MSRVEIEIGHLRQKPYREPEIELFFAVLHPREARYSSNQQEEKAKCAAEQARVQAQEICLACLCGNDRCVSYQWGTLSPPELSGLVELSGALHILIARRPRPAPERDGNAKDSRCW